VDTARLNLRDELLEFAVADEGIAANEGDVQRLPLVEQGEDAVDQLISAKVGELGQQSVVAEVSGVECVAAGATQRAFFSDLDGVMGRDRTRSLPRRGGLLTFSYSLRISPTMRTISDTDTWPARRSRQRERSGERSDS
jgi:hypothetical protein